MIKLIYIYIQMNNFIQEADDAIGYLVQELKKRNLDNQAHIVIVRYICRYAVDS